MSPCKPSKCPQKCPIFITCERFKRIASNLRFAIFSSPKRDWQKGVHFRNPDTIRLILANLQIDSRESGHILSCGVHCVHSTCRKMRGGKGDRSLILFLSRFPKSSKPVFSKQCFSDVWTSACDRGNQLWRDKECLQIPVFSSILVPSALVTPL